MTTRRRPRVAIAVEPTILGDALTAVLREVGLDDVVNLRHPDDPGEGDDADARGFDAAVVTVVLPDSVDVDVVIELPDSASGGGLTNVRLPGQCDTVAVHALDDILRLLDDYCPSSDRRRLPPRTEPGAPGPPA